MTKADFIKKVATTSGYTQKDVGAVLDVITDSIMETVASGDEIKLAGFGTFCVAERAERQGRNPQTGEIMTFPATKAPKFKASGAFKDAVN